MTSDENAQPTLGEQLSLGRNWQPGLSSWRWLELKDASNNSKIHVLAFDTPTGRFAVNFTEAALHMLAEQCLQRASGLTLPPPNGRLRPR